MCPESHVNHAGDAGHEQRDAAPGGRAGAKAAQRPAAVTVSWAAGSGGGGPAGVAEQAAQLVAALDPELGVDVAQVVLDGLGGGDEQPGGDLGVGHALPGQMGDLGFPVGHRLAGWDGFAAPSPAGRSAVTAARSV